MHFVSSHGTIIAIERETGRLRQLRPVDAPSSDIVDIQQGLEETTWDPLQLDGKIFRSGPLAGYVIHLSKDQMGLLLSKDGLFLCAEQDSDVLICNRLTPGNWEVFRVATTELPTTVKSEVLDFNEIVADWIAADFPLHGKSILEVGADDGLRCARRLIRNGANRVLASNTYAGWVKQSSQLSEENRIEVSLANAETLDADFGPCCFDGVVGNNILEHIANVQKAFDAIFRVLRPGGFCWLHGHPLWTSSRGHHILHENYSFGAASPPIPRWAHLYMQRAELVAWMQENNIPPVAAARFQDWIFSGFEINRTPRLDIIKAAQMSRFKIKDIKEGDGEQPDALTIERIKQSRWWHPEERYDISGLIITLVREQ